MVIVERYILWRDAQWDEDGAEELLSNPQLSFKQSETVSSLLLPLECDDIIDAK